MEGEPSRGIVKLPETNPEVIYHFEKDSGKDPKEALHELYALAQPGDVFTSIHKNGGHTMVYVCDVLGDGVKYIVHCWGADNRRPLRS